MNLFNEKILGIDVGKTKIASGIVSKKGDLADYQEVYTEISEEGKNITPQLISIIKDYLSRHQFVERIGVGSFGLIDHLEGVVINNGFLPKYCNLRLKEQIENEFSIPMLLDNDLYTSAIGEYVSGAARGMKSMIFVGVGTSIGSAVILDGKLRRGKHELAGQLAHVLFDASSIKTLHDLTGGSSIAKNGSFALNSISSTKDVLHRWEEGNQIANQIIDDFTTQMSILLAILQNFLDPDIFVLGGGVITNSCENLFEEIQDKTFQRLVFYSPQLVEGKNFIKKSLLGTKSGVIGAAFLNNYL